MTIISFIKFVPPQSSDNSEISSLLTTLISKVDANSIAIQALSEKYAAMENFIGLVASSLDSIDSKLSFLKAKEQKVSKILDFEFSSLQERLARVGKAWEKEFVKLLFKLGSENKFISQQVSALVTRNDLQWYKKKDWIGDCTLEEITAPFPIPAIPPPAVFGMTQAEYREKIFTWLTERDGKAPSEDFYDRDFTEISQPVKYPESKGKGKGKMSDPVNLD